MPFDEILFATDRQRQGWAQDRTKASYLRQIENALLQAGYNAGRRYMGVVAEFLVRLDYHVVRAYDGQLVVESVETEVGREPQIPLFARAANGMLVHELYPTEGASVFPKGLVQMTLNGGAHFFGVASNST